MLRWPESTVYEAIATVTTDQPDSPAFIDADRVVSYDEVLEDSQRIAAGLRSRGIGEGDRIAIWLGNRVEWVSVHLAAAAIGASVVAVNTRYQSHELGYMLDDAAVSVLVTETSFLGREYLDVIADVVPAVTAGPPGAVDSTAFPALEYVVTIDTPTESGRWLPLSAFRSSDSAGYDDAPRGAARDPAVVFYTSGTTSDPKGCLQSHRSLVNHSYMVGEHLGVSADDVALGALPFCGVFGYNMLLSALSHGIPIVLQSHFTPAESIRLIEAHDVTYFSAIGEMYLRMLDDDSFSSDRVSSIQKGAVVFVGTADIDASVERIERAVGFPVVQPYGLSEANSQVFVGDPTDPLERRKRVGGPLIDPDGIAAKIIDPETTAVCDVGEEGELCLRGYCVMNEYLEKPDATAGAFLDGWLRTGDLCVRDPDGYLYYRGRLDDAMRVRGFLVAPSEIEAVINARSDIAIAQVVGAPHPRHGEVPVAFVTPRDDGLTEAQLRTQLEREIADYKVPERVVFVDSFPRTEGPHGRKIQKHVLRDRASDFFT